MINQIATIIWKDPKIDPPPLAPILAVIDRTAIRRGWAEFEEFDNSFYLKNEEDWCEGKITFWANLPKTPIDQEKESDFVSDHLCPMPRTQT